MFILVRFFEMPGMVCAIFTFGSLMLFLLVLDVFQTTQEIWELKYRRS